MVKKIDSSLPSTALLPSETFAKDTVQPESRIQDSTPTKQDLPDADPAYHVVRRGETLGTIADLYGTTVVVLRKLNLGKISRRSLIYPGDELLIPHGSVSVSAPSSLENASQDDTILYRVRPGDTLEKIAIRYNSSIQEIKTQNALTKSLIYPGDPLKIKSGTESSTPRYAEAPAPESTNYSVREGDSLWLIAQRYNISVSTLKEANHLKLNRIKPGIKLRIPI